METINKIQSELKDIMPYLKAKYSIKDIGVFGSYIKNKQSSTSDLDLLVSFTETPSLFKFIELKIFLSEKLKIEVDLVMETALKQNLKKYILDEVVLI